RAQTCSLGPFRRSEPEASVDANGARLVREVSDARAATALIVERQMRSLVPDVVDVGGCLPTVGPQPGTDVAQRVAPQLRIERIHRSGRRGAVADQPLGVR